METCIHDMSIVPEIGDFDFDLTTMDTFDDLDISMENFDIVDTATDPFGDFSLEQSLNLVELNTAKNLLVDDFNSSGDSDRSSFLGDFDIKETIKQDCMWSSAYDINSKSVNIKHKSRSQLDSKLSLTPPTSYINPNLMMFDTPLPSSDDDSSSTDSSSDEIDVVSGFNQCLLKSSIESSSSGDHCYTSGHGKSSSMLTPPESSEDEDSSHDIFKSKAAQDILKTRKSVQRDRVFTPENEKLSKRTNGYRVRRRNGGSVSDRQETPNGRVSGRRYQRRYSSETEEGSDLEREARYRNKKRQGWKN